MVTIKTNKGISQGAVQGTASDIYADCACLVIEAFKIVRNIDTDYYELLKIIFREMINSEKFDNLTAINENEKMYGISYNPEDLAGGFTEDE